MCFRHLIRTAVLGLSAASIAATPAKVPIVSTAVWRQDDRAATLNQAVRYNDLKLVKTLLADGADPKVNNVSGELLLDLVTTPEMVELLVEAGADRGSACFVALPCA